MPYVLADTDRSTGQDVAIVWSTDSSDVPFHPSPMSPNAVGFVDGQRIPVSPSDNFSAQSVSVDMRSLEQHLHVAFPVSLKSV